MSEKNKPEEVGLARLSKGVEATPEKVGWLKRVIARTRQGVFKKEDKKIDQEEPHQLDIARLEAALDPIKNLYSEDLEDLENKIVQSTDKKALIEVFLRKLRKTFDQGRYDSAERIYKFAVKSGLEEPYIEEVGTDNQNPYRSSFNDEEKEGVSREKRVLEEEVRVTFLKMIEEDNGSGLWDLYSLFEDKINLSREVNMNRQEIKKMFISLIHKGKIGNACTFFDTFRKEVNFNQIIRDNEDGIREMLLRKKKGYAKLRKIEFPEDMICPSSFYQKDMREFIESLKDIIDLSDLS